MVKEVTAAIFRKELGKYIECAHAEPVVIVSRGIRRRAVLISPEFYDRALALFEKAADEELAERVMLGDPFLIEHDEALRRLGL